MFQFLLLHYSLVDLISSGVSLGFLLLFSLSFVLCRRLLAVLLQYPVVHVIPFVARAGQQVLHQLLEVVVIGLLFKSEVPAVGEILIELIW